MAILIEACLKVRESTDQLIVGLVLHSHGRPRMIRADRYLHHQK